MCDREADIYEMFVLAEEKQASLVIRAAADRALAEKDVRKLWAKVEQQPLAGQAARSTDQRVGQPKSGPTATPIASSED